MTPRPIRLPGRDFTALSQGEGGERAVRVLVAARRSRTLLLIKYLADRTADGRRAFALLARAHRTAPAEVDRVLDHPRVGDWATRAAVRLGGGAPPPGSLAFIAAAAAVRAGLAATVPVPDVERMPLPSLGIVPHPVAGEVAVTNLTWRPARRLTMPDGVSFELDDWAGAEPPPDLHLAGAVDAAEWQARIAAAWLLLREQHDPVAAEFAAAIRVLTPLRSGAAGVSSATLTNAFGCVFLSLGPDPEQIAVTFAHELQHNKLAALLDLFPLAEPAGGQTFYAPWRDDPRPLTGLLHGTYAHLGVVRFWRRVTAYRPTDQAFVEYARWREAALRGARTLLASGRLTGLGRTFVTGMAEVLARWCAEPLPADAVAEARHRSRLHRARWLDRFGSPGARAT